jgi:hypothetical protein
MVGAGPPGGNGLVAELGGLAKEVVDTAHQGRHGIVGVRFVRHEREN